MMMIGIIITQTMWSSLCSSSLEVSRDDYNNTRARAKSRL